LADDRTNTIVKEIKYWKEHKLLPETQCDFLLALYTQGEDNTISANKIYRKNTFLYIQLILLALMVPFSFLVVYFTQFDINLQLSILVLLLGYVIWVSRYFYMRRINYVHLSIIVLLVLILMTTDHITNILQLNQYVTFTMFFLNFIGWFVLSRKLKYTYLLISSIVAFIIFLFVNFSHLFSFN
jgi:hypothetical protein